MTYIDGLNLRVFAMDRLEDRLEGRPPIKAFCNLIINDVLVIKGLRIVQGQRGLFVSMPQEQGHDKRWIDSVHFKTTGLRKAIQELVLGVYAARSTSGS